MSVIQLSAQDGPGAAEAAAPRSTTKLAAVRIQEQFAASDSLASRIRARDGKPLRDADDIRRGARNFINDMALLAASEDPSTLKELLDLIPLIERRASEVAMILTTDTDECRDLRTATGDGSPEPFSWGMVAGELGCHRNNAYERLTPGVREGKRARRLANGGAR